MNKFLIAMLPWLLQAFFYKAMAQEDILSKDNRKETDEIVIRKKGDKDVNITLQITGDKVIINGKPLMEFNEDGITINKRKIIVRDGNRLMFGNGGGDIDFPDGFSWNNDKGPKKAFLGVTTEKHEDGAKILTISRESAAAKASLEKDDIITKINGKKIDNPQTLSEVISAMKPGEEIKISYKRNGKNKTAKATLQERKESGVRSFAFNGPDGSFKTFTMPNVPGIRQWREGQGEPGEFNFGPEFEKDIEKIEKFDFNFNGPSRKQKLGIRIQDTEDGKGVKILEVDDKSPASGAGLLKDDVIIEIAGEKVNNTDDAREMLKTNNEKPVYVIKVNRKGQPMEFTVKIPKKLKTADL